jgi:predicted  nucleic acid-binding Zn-ribbon protein
MMKQYYKKGNIKMTEEKFEQFMDKITYHLDNFGTSIKALRLGMETLNVQTHTISKSLKSMDERMLKIEETVDENRENINLLLEWAERAGKVVNIELVDVMSD